MRMTFTRTVNNEDRKFWWDVPGHLYRDLYRLAIRLMVDFVEDTGDVVTLEIENGTDNHCHITAYLVGYDIGFDDRKHEAVKVFVKRWKSDNRAIFYMYRNNIFKYPIKGA